MARRGDEAKAEPLDVVKGIVQGVDLQFAAVARTGIDFTNRKRPAEAPSRDALESSADFRQCHRIDAGRGFGQRAAHEAFKDDLAHVDRLEGLRSYRSWPEYEQLNDLLQSGKSATMLPSTAASSSGHWNHDGSRK